MTPDWKTNHWIYPLLPYMSFLKLRKRVFTTRRNTNVRKKISLTLSPFCQERKWIISYSTLWYFSTFHLFILTITIYLLNIIYASPICQWHCFIFSQGHMFVFLKLFFTMHTAITLLTCHTKTINMVGIPPTGVKITINQYDHNITHLTLSNSQSIRLKHPSLEV